MMEDKSVKNEYNIGHRTIFHKYIYCKEDEEAIEIVFLFISAFDSFRKVLIMEHFWS